MAQNKSYRELMELQKQSGGAGGTGGAATSNQMLELILGRKPHSYDPKTDPAAQAARKTAAMNARAATQNTLGQYAGMTGGVPSTAAVSAAAQAGNQALAQGADRVAELEELAYRNYQTEGQNMYNAYAAMQGAEGDAWNRGMQEKQWEYQKAQDEKAAADAEYQKKLAMAQLKASYGDLSGLKELGVDTSKYTAGSGGGGYHYTDRTPAPKVDDKPVGGLSDEDHNKLLMMADANGYLDEDTYNQYAGIYGESVLAAAGFKKKWQEATSGHSGNTGGAAQKEKPGGTGSNRMDMML